MVKCGVFLLLLQPLCSLISKWIDRSWFWMNIIRSWFLRVCVHISLRTTVPSHTLFASPSALQAPQGDFSPECPCLSETSYFSSEQTVKAQRSSVNRPSSFSSELTCSCCNLTLRRTNSQLRLSLWFWWSPQNMCSAPGSTGFCLYMIIC